VRNLISNFGFCFAVGPTPIACDTHSHEQPSKRRKIDNEVRTVSTLSTAHSVSRSILKSAEASRSLEVQAKRAACEAPSEVIIESTASSQTQPTKRGRKKKAETVTITTISEQHVNLDAQVTTSRVRPKRRAAEDAAAKVMADLREEELPIDKKRRDEVPTKTSRRRGGKATTNDATSSLKEGSGAGVILDTTPSTLALAGHRNDYPSEVIPVVSRTVAETKDVGPRKRARTVANATHGDFAAVIIAREVAAEPEPARVPLAEADVNHTVITTIPNDDSKSSQAPNMIRKPRGRPPSKTSARGTAAKSKQRIARLSVHNDHLIADAPSPGREKSARGQSAMLLPAQPSDLKLRGTVSSEKREENLEEESTHNLSIGSKIIATSENMEGLQISAPLVRIQSSTRENVPKSPRSKVHSRTHVDDANINAESTKMTRMNERTMKPLPSYVPPINAASTAATSKTCEISREPVPAKKRGRPRKTPDSAPAEIQAPDSGPSPSDVRETHTGQVSDSTQPSKSHTSHTGPQTIIQVRSRHHVDEDVDWLFAPAPTRSKPVISKPRATAAQQKTHKVSTRDLPEMDLEDLLNGITSLAAVTQPQLRTTKRIKG
jgi:hypothetical protein